MRKWLSSIFGGERLSAAVARDPSDDRMWQGAGGLGARSEIDVRVTVERARQVPVVRAALKILSESVAASETSAVRRDADAAEPLPDHPISQLMRLPNGEQTDYEFLYAIADDLEAHGHFCAEKIYDPMGNLVQLERVDPEGLGIDRVEGRRRFTFHGATGRRRVLFDDEVWYIPLPPLVSSLRGTSPILDDGREAVAVAIALQRYANILFTNDATPPYALSMDGHFDGQDSRDNFMGALRRWSTGRNRHTPAVLEYGLTPHRMGLTAEEAQFLETRQELWLDLARIWRMQPHKLGILDRATNSNIEHQGLEFVTDTLRPLIELIEASVNRHLIWYEYPDQRDVYFEFNVSSHLRGDLKSRYEAYALGRQWGWLSVNDIRRTERKNGIGPVGDRYMEPLNMVPLGTGAGQRKPEERAAIDRSIAFLRESTARNGGRPRLELVKDAA